MGVTVSRNVPVQVPPLVTALKPMLKLPAFAGGVPEMTPVVVLMDNPAGKFVALKLVGSALAVIV